MKMYFRSKVIHINPSLAWITYFCRSHFIDETGIDPFGKKSQRNTELYELKTIHSLGMELKKTDIFGEWNTYAIFVYIKEKILMVMFDMSAPCPYICVQMLGNDGKRQWKSLYYFFARRS